MPLIVKLLKRQISKQLSYGYDVGRGYVAGEEEVRKLIDHMVDQKDIAKNLKQSSDNGRLDVIRCLGKWTVNQMDVIHRHGKWTHYWNKPVSEVVWMSSSVWLSLLKIEIFCWQQTTLMFNWIENGLSEHKIENCWYMYFACRHVTKAAPWHSPVHKDTPGNPQRVEQPEGWSAWTSDGRDSGGGWGH